MRHVESQNFKIYITKLSASLCHVTYSSFIHNWKAVWHASVSVLTYDFCKRTSLLLILLYSITINVTAPE